MIHAADEQAPWPPDSEQLRAALDRAGWRYTRQRAAVFEYLRAVESHPTAEEVYVAVRRQLPKISLATVYKALEALVASRLADKFNTGDGPARYDCHSDAHYHFRCLDSGDIHDLPTPYDPRLIDKLDPNLIEELRRQGFQVTGYRLEVLGHVTSAVNNRSD
jgi:Fur family transcriptional regulator, peroxide stress response regulator